MTRALFAGLLLWVAAAHSSEACMPREPYHGEYARGDLMTQIAGRAAIIQVVRVRGSRPYPAAGSYWTSPDTRSFNLEVVRTLASVPLAAWRRSLWVSGSPLSAGADRTLWQFGQRDRRQRLADGALRNPSDLPGPMGGFEAPEHRSNCQLPYIFSEGDVFIAIRDRSGALYTTGYPEERRLLVATRVLFTDEGAWVAREEAAPGLIRISGSNDPLLLRLEQALLEERAQRNRLDQREWLNVLFALVVGRRGGALETRGASAL